MSGKSKIPEKQEQLEKKPPLFHRKRFNLIYTGIIIALFIVGMTLILVFQIFVDNEYGFFAGLGVLGLSIILFTSRTTYKHSGPSTDGTQDKGEKEKSDDSLQMRRR